MKPSEWCVKEYDCPVAKNDPPGSYFFWMLKLYKLKKAGYTIDNDDLSLSDWVSLGELTNVMESDKERDSMAALGSHMYKSMIAGLSKRSP